MERDRLKKKLRRQTIKNTVFVLLGIGLIAFLLFTFGTQLLVNFSILLTPKGETNNITTSQGINYVAVPDLDQMESATNSAKINVSGTSSVEKSSIKLYVNGVLTDTTEVNDKNEFSFNEVPIDEGSNEIKVKTVTDDGKESAYSTAQTVTFSNKAPELTIEYPQDGQRLKNNQQTLRGKTNSGSRVTVNGFWAIVDAKGNFTYSTRLQDGDNTLKLEATDQAGNKTTKEIRVNYSP